MICDVCLNDCSEHGVLSGTWDTEGGKNNPVYIIRMSRACFVTELAHLRRIRMLNLQMSSLRTLPTARSMACRPEGIGCFSRYPHA